MSAWSRCKCMAPVVWCVIASTAKKVAVEGHLHHGAVVPLVDEHGDVEATGRHIDGAREVRLLQPTDPRQPGLFMRSHACGELR
jgi:hypothetical protein